MKPPRLRFLAILGAVVAMSWWLHTRNEVPPIYAWSTHHLRSVVTSWGACNFGPSSCTPRFSPVPDGSFRGLTCGTSGGGWCVPMTYYFWTDENCNRTTACGLYKPHRGDVAGGGS